MNRAVVTRIAARVYQRIQCSSCDPLILALLVIAVFVFRTFRLSLRKLRSRSRLPSHQAPKDLSQQTASAGQVRGCGVVPDHLLGKDFMPGGNLADYKTADGEFSSSFCSRRGDAQSAAFMLLDWKAVMPDARYLAHMGGYFGEDQGKPLYIFSKGPYLAGIVGLPEARADAEGRRFAARL